MQYPSDGHYVVGNGHQLVACAEGRVLVFGDRYYSGTHLGYILPKSYNAWKGNSEFSPIPFFLCCTVDVEMHLLLLLSETGFLVRSSSCSSTG